MNSQYDMCRALNVCLLFMPKRVRVIPPTITKTESVFGFCIVLNTFCPDMDFFCNTRKISNARN